MWQILHKIYLYLKIRQQWNPRLIRLAKVPEDTGSSSHPQSSSSSPDQLPPSPFQLIHAQTSPSIPVQLPSSDRTLLPSPAHPSPVQLFADTASALYKVEKSVSPMYRFGLVETALWFQGSTPTWSSSQLLGCII